MTHREMVMRETPARKAAAPTMAKIPGEIVEIHCPISLPKKAPASSAGIMIPDGTLQPNVKTVRISFTIVP